MPFVTISGIVLVTTPYNAQSATPEVNASSIQNERSETDFVRQARAT